MAMSQSSQKRLVVYGILLAVVAAAAFGYYYYTQQAGVVSTQVATTVKTEEKLEDIDSSVLDSKKFKELRPVVVPPEVASTTPSITELSDAELDKLKRKKSNPFIPSF